MTITKNQKMLLGVGAVAVVGYLVYQQMNKKSFAGEKMNASGRGIFAPTGSTSKAPKTRYIAGGYDYGHQGGGAQWISYGGAGSAGYWYPCGSPQNPRPCFPAGTVLNGIYQ